jgi:hypothetical protein
MNTTMSRWLMAVAVVWSGLAMAQSEATLNQVYEAAKAGNLEQAQVMMQQVLVSHPNSGKAHFVEAELFARQGNVTRAREELVQAEKLAPGLPFANAQAVQKLRTQLGASRAPDAGRPTETGIGSATSLGLSSRTAVAQQSAAAASSFPTGLGLALGGGAIAAAIFFFMRRRAPAAVRAPGSEPLVQPGYAQGSGLTGPQTFGQQPASGAGAGYAQPGYAGQPGYQQPPAGAGLGGRVMGGLATGLAVGAGVMAAEAIGRNLMGHGERTNQPAAAAGNDYVPLASDPELGGNNFGVADGGSWDDANGLTGGADGGGDWDSN